jgi:uncharacterized SAM-binding protein YcdF (DUF218 family)
VEKRIDMKKGIVMVLLVLLGVSSIAYGLYVRRAASGTSFFMVWILMGIALCFVGVLAYVGVFAKIPSVVKVIIGVMVTLGLVMLVVINGLLFSTFASKGDDNLDYLIVLGAQMKNSGPSVALRYRLDATIEYMEKNKNTKCIVSGGQGSNEPVSEAEGMEKYLIEHGIDVSRIIKEDKSTSTKENFDFSMKVVDLKDKKVGIVTNNFHTYRARAIAKKCGLEDVSTIAAGSVKTYLPNNMFKEDLAFIKDFLVGNI